MSIVCFGGRQQSGKTTLSKHFVNNGFQILSFADTLRKYVSIIYNVSVADLKDKNKKEAFQLFTWGPNEARKMEQLASLPEGCLIDSKHDMESIRILLQFVGTSVLRQYDDDIHVKWTAETIDPLTDYVVDDVRFPNELKLLNDMGALSIYVIRPNNFKYSTHTSETLLRRSNFKYWVINDEDLDYLNNQFNNFVYDYFQTSDIEAAEKHLLYDHSSELIDTSLEEPTEEVSYWVKEFTDNGRILQKTKKCFCLYQHHDKNMVLKFKQFLHLKQKIKALKVKGELVYQISFYDPLILDDMKYYHLNINNEEE